MRRERLARPPGAAPVVRRPGRVELGLDRAQPGLDLLEGEGLLVGVELFGAAAEAGPLQLLDDRVKGGDPRLGPLADPRKPADLGFEILPLRGRGRKHRLQRVGVVGRAEALRVMAPTKAHFARFEAPLSAP